ncbi:MAG: PLP-dependent aminotransferase family protein, partial [Arenimonas sp.]
GLRAAIAQHVSFTRAVACGPDDVVVTAGAQQAFDLLARILITPGRTVVALENPGYPPMRAAFAAAGAKIVAVPVDAEGLVVEHLPAATRVIGVTPSHQFPLGSVMSARRRAALLEFAQRRGAVVIEDDYDGEFRFDARPLDALQTLDRAESVFYVGTFSKSLFPTIRLGYVVAPQWARAAVVAARQYSDWHSAVAIQDTLASFITEGHLTRHVRKMRELYGDRRQALLEGLRVHLGDRLELVPSAAGLHLAALSSSVAATERIVERARAQGVGLNSLRAYYWGKPVRAGLVFGYGAIEAGAIDAGLLELRNLWRV